MLCLIRLALFVSGDVESDILLSTWFISLDRIRLQLLYTQRERANGGSVRMAARKESGIDGDTRVTQKTGIQLGG